MGKQRENKCTIQIKFPEPNILKLIKELKDITYIYCGTGLLFHMNH
jgi:hypothetical protein